MSVYSIKDLEGLTNLKAHTIRTWELRYDLLKPKRTDTNIRYYDDEQLKKLLNVCELMNKGMKISKISKLSNKQIEAEIDRLIESSFKNDTADAIVTQALIATATFDEVLFEKIFSNSVRQFGMVKTYLNVIYPLMMRAGLMWAKSEILPSQEHFISNLIRKKLFAAIDSLPMPVASDQTWVLFLNENEEHEIGLLFAAFILRQQGIKTIYLGSNVPYSNLTALVTQCKPTHLYTFITRNMLHVELTQLFNNLSSDFKKLKICVSARKEISDKIPLNKNTHIIDHANALIALSAK